MCKHLISALGALVLLATSSLAGSLADGFAHPPADARPMVRWWWFGPNVQDHEIIREIRAMKAGGFGGFELQTVYPLSLDGNTEFLSAAHLKAIHLANETARADGMRVDVTLGSGWPFGGPHIPINLAATGVKLVRLAIPKKSADIELPELQPGESVIAAFVGEDIAVATLVEPAGHRIRVEPSAQDRTLFVVVQNPTGQQVKRAAVGAEGNVLDHMSAAAVNAHLAAVGDKLLGAFGNDPPFAVFSDSLEVFGADWTPDLLGEFRKRRGYDLKPHLLDIFRDGPDPAAVRHDWGLTLSELTDQNYLASINQWAHEHRTKFRSQTYGFPPVTLSSNRLVDLPEGEGARWRAFSTTRWASSANHIYGNAVTSAESWTWLHQGAFRATPLDIKAEADVLMLEGVNQFIAHGWPYSPPSAPEPGWALYAAAVFNDHNPWWGVMADVNRYLQRMSYLLRQGEPVADVAILLPEDDALAEMKLGEPTVSGQMSRFVTQSLTEQILDAGYNFDYVDGRALLEKGLPYKALVLPNVSRIATDVMLRIEAFSRSGGIVFAVNKMPDAAPGLMNASADAQHVQEISRRIVDLPHNRVLSEAELGGALQSSVKPDFIGAPAGVGFVHRKLSDGELYFVANTGNRPVKANLSFRDQARMPQWWDARSGETHAWNGKAVDLAPYESRIFVFGVQASAPIGTTKPMKTRSRVLTEGWSIAFGHEPKRRLPAFVSWSAMPDRQYYSGVATYSTTVTLSRKDIAGGLTALDFGTGDVLSASPLPTNGTKALLTPPVREAAEVFVNGKRAGAVWTPPFVVSLKGFVRPGRNELEVRVANTAINLLAGRPPADYSALNAKYGERFQPQNMNDLKPLPSGLLRAPTLTVTP